MSAAGLARHPDVLRAEAKRARETADRMDEDDLIAVGLRALAVQLDDIADQIDALPPAARDDLIEMLGTVTLQ